MYNINNNNNFNVPMGQPVYNEKGALTTFDPNLMPLEKGYSYVVFQVPVFADMQDPNSFMIMNQLIVVEDADFFGQDQQYENFYNTTSVEPLNPDEVGTYADAEVEMPFNPLELIGQPLNSKEQQIRENMHKKEVVALKKEKVIVPEDNEAGFKKALKAYRGNPKNIAYPYRKGASKEYGNWMKQGSFFQKLEALRHVLPFQIIDDLEQLEHMKETHQEKDRCYDFRLNCEVTFPKAEFKEKQENALLEISISEKGKLVHFFLRPFDKSDEYKMKQLGDQLHQFEQKKMEAAFPSLSETAKVSENKIEEFNKNNFNYYKSDYGLKIKIKKS